MKVLQVESQERYRIDKITARAYGAYTEPLAEAVMDANPNVNFADLATGTFLKVKDLSEIED
jgi:phage tail protein X